MIQRNVKKLFISATLFLIVDIPLASAQVGNAQLQNPLSVDTIPEFLTLLLDAVIKILTPVVVFMIIYTGFKFVTARGNPNKLENAKKALLYTLIGAAIIIGAQLLSTAVQNTISNLGA